MRWWWRIVACGLLLAVAGGADKPAGKARVSLELVTEKGLPITGTQEWYQVLTDAGITNLRIRGAGGGEETGIEKLGTKESPRYQVVGIVKADNTLYLPGGKFTTRDSARLKKWLADLSDLGKEGVTQPKSAFGMTPSQIVEINDDLKRPVAVATKDVPASQAIEKIALGLKHGFEIDAAARKALLGTKIEEELVGLSSGTAVAVILRPAGLVLTPERPAGGSIRYRVSKPAEGRESWPIGWKLEEQDRKVVPKLFEMINVEIDETPVSEAVAALEGRLKIPFLWDHNALALHGIDPTKINAKLPAKKLSYSLILQRVLSQAKLKKELRVDEAGKPFLWITTIKPS